MLSVFAGRHSPVTAGRHRHRPASLPGYWLPVLLLGAVCLAGCSEPPVITTLEPAEGHPHDVVLIKGTDLDSAEIVWDLGKPGQKVIPGGYQGAYMFSVPHDAVPLNATTPRKYSVVVRKGGVDSKPMTFTVQPPPGPNNIARPPGPEPAGRKYPPPRIDAVTLVGATFEPGGVRATLYVQGANLDVGAIVSVTEDLATDPVPVATTSHRVLKNQWFEVPDTEFEYPIYHYSSAIAVPGLRPAGQRIWVVVTNLDDEKSVPFDYLLPTDANAMDSDGDSLPDVWETGGFDAEGDGVVDVDLPALGADPYRRDVFVELDVMETLNSPPGKPVFDAIKDMFAFAPILNFGNAQGINLVIDASGKPCLQKPTGGDKCEFFTIHFDIGGQVPMGEPNPFGTPPEVRFSMLKRENFDDHRRGKIYHYGIWGRHQGNSKSGFSDMGDDFVITFDELGPTYYKPRSGVEALAHELGHDLKQLHSGGADYPNMKPNYLGVMSYTWLFRTAWEPTVRLTRATCVPLYYAHPDAVELSGSAYPNVNTIVDYSEGMGRPLKKPTPAGGSTSMCGTAIDWATVDPDALVTEEIKDFPNWPWLKFDGPQENGNLKE